MSDVALARNIITEIAGNGVNGAGDMLERAYKACERFAESENREPVFTRRRLRGFWHREAAGVRFFEMIELAKVADAERAHRESIAKARSDHAEFITKATTLLDRLSVADEEFHREHIRAIRSLAVEPAGRKIEQTARQGDQMAETRRDLLGNHAAGAIR